MGKEGDSTGTGRSTSGYLLTIGGGGVSWSSRLQSLVAQSTTEAEYIAAVDAGREAIWMRNLLQELGYTLAGPTVLHMDNQSAISVAKNLLNSEFPSSFLCDSPPVVSRIGSPFACIASLTSPSCSPYFETPSTYFSRFPTLLSSPLTALASFGLF